jgi:hypothetical protein
LPAAAAAIKNTFLETQEFLSYSHKYKTGIKLLIDTTNFTKEMHTIFKATLMNTKYFKHSTSVW